MSGDRWTDDAFLDGLRQQGDDLADGTVKRLHEEHGLDAVNRIFQSLAADHQPLPADAPEPFRKFMDATAEPPPGIDFERLNRGARVFRTHTFPACVALIASSLPCGYSAPCLSRILTVSNNLGNHPYRRLMGVLQMVVNVSTNVPSAGDERAHLTARKLRLLHSGIRFIVPKHRPDYRQKFGEVCNHEDMLGTIMGFSYLVIDGLRRLEVGLTDEQAEDYYYLWQAFIRMMGIHPPGEPQSTDYVPQSVAEAAAFYGAYSRRNYTGPEDNPDGAFLARKNLEMMRDLIPRRLRLLGLGRLPRLAMQELLGEAGMRRVGVRPAFAFGLQRGFFDALVRLVQRFGGGVHEHFVGNVGLLVFQRLINVELGGEMRFIVPEDLQMQRQKL